MMRSPTISGFAKARGFTGIEILLIACWAATTAGGAAAIYDVHQTHVELVKVRDAMQKIGEQEVNDKIALVKIEDQLKLTNNSPNEGISALQENEAVMRKELNNLEQKVKELEKKGPQNKQK